MIKELVLTAGRCDFPPSGLSVYQVGEMPPELGSLANLTELRLYENGLSGCVPSSLEDQLDTYSAYFGDLRFC